MILSAFMPDIADDLTACVCIATDSGKTYPIFIMDEQPYSEREFHPGYWTCSRCKLAGRKSEFTFVRHDPTTDEDYCPNCGFAECLTYTPARLEEPNQLTFPLI